MKHTHALAAFATFAVVILFSGCAHLQASPLKCRAVSEAALAATCEQFGPESDQCLAGHALRDVCELEGLVR
jgi:hypothetical protein